MYDEDKENEEREESQGWGFWRWFFTVHGVALSAIGLASCMQQAMH